MLFYKAYTFFPSFHLTPINETLNLLNGKIISFLTLIISDSKLSIPVLFYKKG